MTVKHVKYGQIKTLHVALTSASTRRGQKSPPSLTEGLFFVHCAASVQGSSHICMRGKFKCLKGIVNNKGKKYVKGTWNIIRVNVNLNTVSISSPRRKVQHSCTLSTYLNSQLQLQKNTKTNNGKINKTWYIQKQIFIELGHVQFSCPRLDSLTTPQQRQHGEADGYRRK